MHIRGPVTLCGIKNVIFFCRGGFNPGGGGVLPHKGLVGTCGQPGYVFWDFCLKQGIALIIFCLKQGIALIIFCLNQGIDLSILS